MSLHQPLPAGVPKVTEIVADWAVRLEDRDIPSAVRAEGVRTFVNWLGCAVGGAEHETVEHALQTVMPFSGAAVASVIGRPEKLDALHAALINGISSHVLDYDDTHLKTIIHPAGPVASALLALAEMRPISGPTFLTALIAGIEIECRIGNAVYPDHYDRGWHITGTAGVFGAAVATGKAMRLSQKQLRWAIGLAATQSSGLREMFGTMTKSFHPGRAAQNGLFAALLAENNFDSSERGIEAPRGFASVASNKQDYSQIVDDLGTHWEAALNSYKPFSCGIVIHPAIDGCIQLRDTLSDRVSNIEQVRLQAHPLVLELTGKTAPQTGLEAKFSVYHAAAVALLKGDGGPTAFTNEIVKDPEIIALRDKIKVEPDPGCHEASVRIEVRLSNGTTEKIVVERAIGSTEKPLTNDQIDRKFLDQASLVIGKTHASDLLNQAWKLEQTQDVGILARASASKDKRAG